MNRFTKRKQDGHYVYIHGTFHFIGEHIDKLGQIEDIEDELGIDLVVLFKALKNGIYYNVGSKVIEKYSVDGQQYIDIDIQDLYINLMYASSYEDCCHCEMSFPLKYYGKLWALTREELL